MAEVIRPERTLSNHAEHVRELTEKLGAALRTLDVPAEPAELYDPVRYVLDGGGKRLRPVLVLLAAEAAGGSTERAMPAALAVEVFHNFTLVHDDIMDHAAERRGRPSVHVVWNESAAILAGDLMMGMSYELLASTPAADVGALVKRFYRMVVAVCEGQALDEAFEQRASVSLDEYLGMIYRKTGALIECALDLGARVAGADTDVQAALSVAGRELGLAFQIQDDLLDLIAEDATWGKTIGGDLIEAKKTYLLVRAIEKAEGGDRAWFEAIVENGGLAPHLVDEARERMRRLGVMDDAEAAVRRHSERGIASLRSLPDSFSRDTLIWLTDRLASRAN